MFWLLKTFACDFFRCDPGKGAADGLRDPGTLSKCIQRAKYALRGGRQPRMMTIHCSMIAQMKSGMNSCVGFLGYLRARRLIVLPTAAAKGL